MENGLCFRCGGDIPAAQEWCPYCGTPVVGAPPRVQPASPPPPWEPPPAPAHRRGPALIAAAVVGLLLLSAGVVAGVARLTRSTPESATEDYFGALTDGDAAAALKLIATADHFDPSPYPLLTAAALAEDRWRPRDVRVGDAGSAVQYGSQAQRVEVRYRTGDQTVSQDVILLPEDGEFRLRLPFVVLGVDGQRGREIRVNGVSLGTAPQPTVAFPGTYDATAAANTLLAESRTTAVAQPNGLSGYAASLQFGAPELAAGAEQAIQGQVRAALDQCATSVQAQPPGCPFGLNVPGTGVTVRWSITAYPAVSARADSTMWFGAGAVQLTDDGAGRVHWSAGYTDYSGTTKSQSGDTPFRINGSAQAAPNGIQVSLT
ncbi:zinc ribbon domain-containing protein [Actinoplanes awajinensis]|uniref:hypothetical protein n=1 Tax=Actinoplanes awajinensis TaxID=135946 RepID=UPI000A56C506|nr:hypothetical protein [Actinoplanes awajinensis]